MTVGLSAGAHADRAGRFAERGPARGGLAIAFVQVGTSSLARRFPHEVRERAMTLTRSIANPPLTIPKGIEFTLLDRSKIVRCIITQAALEKLAGKELASDQFERTFHKHQDRIEATASRKYAQ